MLASVTYTYAISVEPLPKVISITRYLVIEYRPLTTHAFSLVLTKKDWYDYQLTYEVRWKPRGFEPVINYYPRLSFYFLQIFDGGWDQKLRFIVKAYSIKLKGTFDFNTEYQYRFSKGNVNGTDVNRIVNRSVSRLKYVSNFKSIYNFELQYSYSLNYFKQKGITVLKANNADAALTLSQRIDFSKKFFVGSLYSHYKYSFGEFNQLGVFSTWKINRSTRVELRGVNLLNQRFYTMQSNDVNNIFRLETAVARPYVLVTVSQSF